MTAKHELCRIRINIYCYNQIHVSFDSSTMIAGNYHSCWTYSGDTCEFPFKYKGRTYEKCTMDVVLYVDGWVLQRLILNEIANMAVDYMIMIGVFVNLWLVEPSGCVTAKALVPPVVNDNTLSFSLTLFGW